MEMEANDRGLIIRTEIGMVSDLKMNLTNLEGIELGLRIEHSVLARTKIDKVSLAPGYQMLSLTIHVYLDGSPEEFKKCIDSIAKRLLSSDVKTELDVAIVGPVLIQGKSILQGSTGDLAIRIPLREVIEKSGQKASQALARAAKDIMALSRVSADLNSERILAPAKLVLPAFVALPRNLRLPFAVVLSIGSGTTSAMSVRISPTSIIRDDKFITLDTSVTVIPVNTPEAADAMAAAINPLVAEPSRVCACLLL